jgi:hypothetical protein
MPRYDLLAIVGKRRRNGFPQAAHAIEAILKHVAPALGLR